MSRKSESRPGSIVVCVRDGCGDESVAIGAYISVYRFHSDTIEGFDTSTWGANEVDRVDTKPTEKPNGCVTFPGLPEGCYVVTYDHEPQTVKTPRPVKVEAGCITDVCFELELGACCEVNYVSAAGQPTTRPQIGDFVEVTAKFGAPISVTEKLRMEVKTPGFTLDPDHNFTAASVLTKAGRQIVELAILLPPVKPAGENGSITKARHVHAELPLSCEYTAFDRISAPSGGKFDIRLLRSRASATNTFALWTAIRNRTKAISFSGSGYKSFIDRVLCQSLPLPQSNGVNAVNAVLERQRNELSDHVYGTAAYDLLKTATEVFLLLECGVKIKKHGAGDAPSDPPILDLVYESQVWDQVVDLEFLKDQLGGYLGGKALPYIERVIAAAFPGQKKGGQFCEFVLTSRATDPCFLELIWNYWHEEGMLVQSINAISRRFQNVRAPGERDPLAHLEIDPLRPLNNILWGYVEDERSRLSVKRRVYEYHHHYGLNLYGKAVPDLRPADNRSKFLEAFHNLLHTASEYFKAVQDTTVVPDGYPLLHALKEVHLILAQGAHNQFGDLPWTARVEMLMQQWILARPEIRDFLQSRAMVPYREGWMPQVDTMKTLQGWSDVTITHFRDLGVYGEQILLSIRYHNWNDINDEEEAKGWADNWRPELQGYLHAYRAVTGVDLSNPDTVDYTLPSVHLRKRLSMQQRAR